MFKLLSNFTKYKVDIQEIEQYFSCVSHMDVYLLGQAWNSWEVG